MLVMQCDLPSQNGLDGLKLTGNSWETCERDGWEDKHMATYETQKEEKEGKNKSGGSLCSVQNLFRQSPTIVSYCLVLS